MANSAQVSCAASYPGFFSFELRAGQTEQQGPGVSQGSGRCVCLEVAPEREISSFASAQTGEHRNCLRAEPLIVWMLAYRCKASAWMQSSPGKPGVISMLTLYCGSIWEPQPQFRAPLCRELIVSRGGMKGDSSSGAAWSLMFFLKFYGKKTLILKWVLELMVFMAI